MKIFVKSRRWIKGHLEANSEWHHGKWIISIFSTDSQSPFLPRFNVLPLQFDDISERDVMNADGLTFFDDNHAKQIYDFIKEIDANSDKPFYIHCDAGVSRSGAVGYMLNEWFNKFQKLNKIDNEFFKMENSHIMPNPLVVRLLKNKFFGNDYKGVFINDYTYNEDGEKIDHFEEI